MGISRVLYYRKDRIFTIFLKNMLDVAHIFILE